MPPDAMAERAREAGIGSPKMRQALSLWAFLRMVRTAEVNQKSLSSGALVRSAWALPRHFTRLLSFGHYEAGSLYLKQVCSRGGDGRSAKVTGEGSWCVHGALPGCCMPFKSASSPARCLGHG